MQRLKNYTHLPDGITEEPTAHHSAVDGEENLPIPLIHRSRGVVTFLAGLGTGVVIGKLILLGMQITSWIFYR